MKPTWSDIICIIEYMFDFTQDDIVASLGTSKSVVSKLKSGETQKPISKQFERNAIYENIFDPNNAGTSVKGQKERRLWTFLKEIIEEANFQDAVEELWEKKYEEGDYKKLVLRFLKNTRRTPKNEKSSLFFNCTKPQSNDKPQQAKLTHTTPKAFRNFIAREKEFEKMNKLLSVNHYLILEGMGGIGKTELAKQYASKYKYDIFQFVRFQDSIEYTIAHNLKFDNFDDKSYFDNYKPTEAINELFNKKISFLLSCKEKKLIIIDNEGAAHIEKIIAPHGEYDIICTTREKSGGDSVLEIPVMQDDDLMKLFCEYYKRPLSSNDKPLVQDIINLVSGHTMTVMIIALAMQANHENAQGMLELLKRGLDTEFPTGIQIKKEGISDEERLMYCHLTNLFDMTILKENKDYTCIMTNMAIVPCSGIDLKIFYEWALFEWYNIDGKYKHMNKLINLRWIQHDEQTNKLSLHPVISDIATSQLKPDSQKCKSLILRMVSFVESCIGQTYIEHAIGNEMLNIAYQRINDETMDTANLYKCYGDTFAILSDYASSLRCYKKAVAMLENIQSEPCVDVSKIYSDIARAYFNLRKYDDSLNWHKKTLDIDEALFGTEHPYTAFVYNNMGLCYASQGKNDEALELYQKAASVNFSEYSDEIQHFAPIIYDNIARIYSEQGKYDEALELYYENLKIHEKNFGKENVIVYTAKNNIANIHAIQGKYEEALELYRQFLNVYEKTLGVNHIIIGGIYGDIALIYIMQNELEKALEWFQKAQNNYENVFGANHQQTIKTTKFVELIQKIIAGQHAWSYSRMIEKLKENNTNMFTKTLPISPNWGLPLNKILYIGNDKPKE